jgi:hypothetical protein
MGSSQAGSIASRGFFQGSLSRGWPMWLAPIAAVEYLEAAPPLVSNHGLVRAIAQARFDEPAGRLSEECLNVV